MREIERERERIAGERNIKTNKKQRKQNIGTSSKKRRNNKKENKSECQGRTEKKNKKIIYKTFLEHNRVEK